MTLALFESYLQGLQALRDTLGTEHPQRELADVYQQRLKENIDRTRYGNTAALDADRAEILDRCNALCRGTLGLPFEDFCAQVKPAAALLTARLPEDVAALQPLYCAALQGQRALRLLDNAKNAAQLKPLLPPPSCLLLVTSRQRFSLPGLRPLDLDARPLPEAIALLREMAPRIGEHAQTLAELCGCLPLALRWAGDALNDTTVAVPRYLEWLQAGRKLLEPAEASLRLSYDLLPPDLQSRWRQLSVFPADFDWEAAAAVWDIKREAAEDALDALPWEIANMLPIIYDCPEKNRQVIKNAKVFISRAIKFIHVFFCFLGEPGVLAVRAGFFLQWSRL